MQYTARVRRRRLLDAVGTVVAVGLIGIAAGRSTAQDNKPGKILFSSNRAGETQFNIYMMNEDGSNQTALTKGDGMAMDAVWSPDGKTIVYDYVSITDPLHPVGDIFVMNADGSMPKRLTRSAASEVALGPSWSPDGKRIVYCDMKVKVGEPSKTTITAMNADGSNARAIGDGFLPTWSPDGKQILYSVMPQGAARSPNLSVMDADGGNVKSLNAKGIMGAWSPDGKHILFAGQGSGPEPKLFVMDADGSHTKQLTRSADEAEVAAQWTPDGKRILFTRLSKGRTDKDPLLIRIFSMDADGGNARALTDEKSFNMTCPNGVLVLTLLPPVPKKQTAQPPHP